MLWWWKSPCTSVVRRDVERGVELASERDELMRARLVEPAAARGRRSSGTARRRSPELTPGRDGDRGRLVLRQLGDVVPARALDQERSPRPISPQQPHGAVAGPKLERIRLLVRLVVLGRRHLQHRVVAGRRDVRVPRQRERLAELDSPLHRNLARDPLQRRESGRSSLTPKRKLLTATNAFAAA